MRTDLEGFIESADTLDARQFYIAIKRLADSFSYGTDRSPFVGSGVEYVQSRQYQYGDPIRAIDWRVTARTGKIYIKEFETPKRMPCYIMIDTSASMTISSTKRSKYATAIHIAGGLALACLDRVSPVGVLGVGSRDFRIEPSLAKNRILEWLHQLRHFRYDEETTLVDRISELIPTLNSRALFIVLSDLHDDRALMSLKRMGQKHDCVVLQMQDPAELSLRGAGFLRAQEAETGRAFVTHGRQIHVDQLRIEDELKRGGIDHLVVRTDQPFTHHLRSFFKSRDLLGKGSR